MHKYLITLSYDGSQYSGWQIQPNAPSIQEEVQKVLFKVLQQKIVIKGAGRTDRGVHALGQTAHFVTEEPLDERKVLFSLNGLLPWDIRVKTLDLITQDGFHARYSAKGKEYRYHFWTDPVVDPMVYRYRLHMRKPLDPQKILKALPLFVGEHDFTTFANLRLSGQVIGNGIRHLKSLEMVEQEGGFRVEFKGNGFLYKMVRNIVGVLIEIGQGRRELSTIKELFAAKDRNAIGAPAPAHGLFLQKVIY